jgi:hypothetical protein
MRQHCLPDLTESERTRLSSCQFFEYIGTYQHSATAPPLDFNDVMATP